MLRRIERNWKDPDTQKAQKQYFKVHLNYHSEEGNSEGEWYGKGAGIMELEGEVTEKQYDSLAKNRHHKTGEKLKSRDLKTARLNEEMVIAPPKSVSVAWGLLGDERIKDAHEGAVKTMLAYMEKDVQARKRAGLDKDADLNEYTGNLLASIFHHDTARAVGDQDEDMFLHSHILLWNYTQDTAGKWKAAQLGNILSSLQYYEAVYHSTIAHHLQKLGYAIERKGKKWELKGFSKELLEKFSKRSTQVAKEEARLQEEMGRLLSDKERDKLGERTRGKKQDTDIETLKASWKAQLSENERSQLSNIKKVRNEQQRSFSAKSHYTEEAAKESIDYAIGSIFERRSVVKRSKFMADAIMKGIGDTTVEQVEQAVSTDERLKFGKDNRGLKEVTTTSNLKEEARILSSFKRGIGKMIPLVKEVENYRFKKEYLKEETHGNKGQREAVKHVLGSTDRFTLVRGRAGVGKTTSSQELQALLGDRLMAFAPTTNAVDVLKQDGFKHTNTVQLLERSPKLQKEAEGKVWLIDEAATMGGESMLKITALAEKGNARVILMGDDTQHEAVTRGNPFRLASKFMKHSIKVAEIDHIWRQEGKYKEAVEEITKGNIGTSLEKLKGLGWVHEKKEDIYKEVAKTYADIVEKGNSVAATAPIHKEKNKVSAAIREELRERGKIGQKETTINRFRPRNDLTIADRKDITNYEVGQVVKFNQNAKGFNRGSKHEVISVDGEKVLVKELSKNEKRELPLKDATRFNIYDQEEIQVSVGDELRIDSRSRKENVYNGQICKIKSIKKDTIEFTNGTKLPKDFGHIDHAYTRTSHSVQGSTIDHIIPIISGDSHRAAGLKQWYVDVSRGKKGCHIFTDDVEQLERSIAQDQYKKSALEMKQEHANKVNNEIQIPKNPVEGIQFTKPKIRS